MRLCLSIALQNPLQFPFPFQKPKTAALYMQQLVQSFYGLHVLELMPYINRDEVEVNIQQYLLRKPPYSVTY